MTRTIPLTRGYVTIVDEDYEWLSQWKWHCRTQGKSLYACRSQHIRLGKNRYTARPVYMHRIITGAENGDFVDHANCDGLDNRRLNLRICEKVNNQHNLRKPVRSDGVPATSHFKGVYKDARERRSKRWIARIRAHGKQHYIGAFLTEAEAAEAYDTAARQLHGEFARLNFD